MVTIYHCFWFSHSEYRKLSPLQEFEEGDYKGETGDTLDEELGEVLLSQSEAVKSQTSCDGEIPNVSQVKTLKHQQYSCSFCEYTSPRLNLSKHLQEEHLECLQTCVVCSLKYVNPETFDVHSKSHLTGEYTCEDCNIKFGSDEELSNHQSLIHAEKNIKFNCPLCEKVFERRSKFVTHVIKFHKGKVQLNGLKWGNRGTFECSSCQKRFKKASLYIAHEKTHINTLFICQYCRKAFSSHTALQDHILTHEFGDYECSLCCVKFSSYTKKNSHTENIHKIECSKICEYCNKEFQEHTKLICHKREEHPESVEFRSAKYLCSVCGRRFVVEGNLVTHMRLHDRGNVGRRKKCDICGKILANKYSLSAHMRTHTWNTLYKCNICDKAFISKYTLVDHVRRIHEEVGYGRDKVCTQCGRSFFTNTELKYHIKTHTGERPYRCELCGETYLSSSTLRYHMQKHSSVMFVCQKCPSKFKNYVGWSAHMKRSHGISCVRDYVKQNGLFASVAAIKKQSPVYVVSQEHTDSVDVSANILSKETLEKDNTSSCLTVDMEETVVSMPGKEVANIIHIVSYDTLTNPLVHTVDAAEDSLANSKGNLGISQSDSHMPSGSELKINSVDSVTEANFPQTCERSRGMIPEGWELILSGESGESQVISDEWEGTPVVIPEVSQTGEDHQMILANEWDGTEGMAQLVISEEGDETRVVMTSWKDCVDY